MLSVSKRFVFLLIVLFLVASGAVGYLVFRPQISDLIVHYLIGRRPAEAEKEEPCSGEVYANSRQGYTVCYPSGWHTREFGYSQLKVGFDSFAIPKASEYGGMFVVSVSRQGSASFLAQDLEELEEPATSAAQVDQTTGIEVRGIFPSDHAFFANYFKINTVVESSGRTYVIQLFSAPDGYEENITRYNAFVESFRFLEGVPAAPWGKDIYLESPWPEDEVKGSFGLVGTARGAFENTLVARLKNETGEVLLEEPVTYKSSEVGGLGSFDLKITYSTTSSSGTLEVFHASPKGGAIVDLVSVPLSFK